eukprot:gb/GEZN01006505.1/.p1 GENE.gb/GEZN01006505.1/~~gb/GEZN01006505.1/.p1  ORF type:complete len:371 (+),score=29.88 gb/GEZN01006505.1/:81-1115(+)
MLEEHHIKELFEVCGVIKNLTMRADSAQKTCFIEFEDSSHAQAASMLDGTPLGDRPLKVEAGVTDPLAPPAGPPSNKFVQAGANPLASMMMANPLSAASLLPMTNPLNPLFSQALVNNPGLAGLPALSASMAGAQPMMNGLVAGPQWTSRTVYVGNLAGEVTEQQLRAFFQHVGMVMFCQIRGDNPTAFTKYAFVEFQAQDQAEKALLLTGGMIGGRQIKVGKANDPIGKPSNPHPNKLKAALAALQRISDRVAGTDVSPTGENSDEDAGKGRSRSRDRSRRPRSSRRSESRERRPRSRERERRRDRDGEKPREDRPRDGDREKSRGRDRDRRRRSSYRSRSRS